MTLPTLMSFEDWQKGTALTLQTRSELLRALDLEIQQYERNPTVFRLSRVQEGLQAWKKSKGPDGDWKKDQRNGNGTVSLLDQQLRGQPITFNNWFKRYAIGITALSVLALNSGICGDKMHFLAMFKDDASVVSQTEFDAGVRYVDGLKSWGSDYLKDAGFSFASADPVVTGLLKLATSHAQETGVAAKAWKATLGFLNA